MTGNVASSPISALATLAAKKHWTPARMASAKPRDIAVADGNVFAAETAAAPSGPSGPQVDVPPTTGTLSSNPLPLNATGAGRPYTDLPDRLNGKVFFSDGVDDYVCSGTVVASNSADMVDTAGHCVSDGAGNFYQDWVFVPAFSSGAPGCTTQIGCLPYGVWSVSRLTTTAQWLYSRNLKEDYGYAVMDTLNGEHIADYLGGQGSRFNASRNQTWTDVGYPEEPPFNGSDQEQCVSGRQTNDNPIALPGELTIGITCNMTGGASGGGWLISISNSSGLGYVNSHNSYRYVSGPRADANAIYGPYYGDDAYALFSYTEGLPPGVFASLAPTRMLDTRDGTGAVLAPVGASGSVAVQVMGRAGVPVSGVSAVVMNVTVTSPTGFGFVTAYADGAVRPLASNLNFLPGQTVPNLVVVPVGGDGKVRLFNGSTGTVDLIADIAGYYIGGTPSVSGAFASLSPARLLDTRDGTGAVLAPVGASG
ncbi:MAG: hypothetical protein ABJD68_20515, partial [Nakamurella sp.]